MTRDRSRERQKLPRTSHKHNASVFIDISIKYKLAYINTIVLTSQKVFIYIGAPALSTAHLPRPFAAMFLPFPENTECCAAFRGKYHSVTCDCMTHREPTVTASSRLTSLSVRYVIYVTTRSQPHIVAHRQQCSSAHTITITARIHHCYDRRSSKHNKYNFNCC